MAAGALLLAACNPATPAPQTPTPPVQTFSVGEIPRGLIFDGRFIWVAAMGSDSVSKLDLDGRLAGSFPAGLLPQDLAFDGSHLWVANADGRVTKLSTNGETTGSFEVGKLLSSITHDGRFIWAADTLGDAVTKLNLDGSVIGTYPVGNQPQDLLHDGQNLWVTNLGGDSIMKLNDQGDVILTVPVEQPKALAYDSQDLWVINSGVSQIPGSTVTKLNRQGRPLAVYRVGVSPNAILYANNAVWVANNLTDFSRDGHTLTGLSLDGQPLARFTAGATPQGIAYDGASLWVANRDDDSVAKVTLPTPLKPLPPTHPEPVVEPDPGYPRAMAAAGIDPGDDLNVWHTDFSLHSAPYAEILPGGIPRDGIPPLDNPQFTSTADADRWLDDPEPVMVLDLEGDARAYPLQVLIWHEIVNDRVGGLPVAVTYCPLCNSAIAFDRRLEGVVYDFGVSGYLRNFDLIMWDRQTESWWQQITGEAIVGVLTGQRLNFLPAAIVSWKEFKAAHPNGTVLSRPAGSRPYGQNPYRGYDGLGRSPPAPGDRPQPLERVAALTVGGVHLAVPYSVLSSERVVNHTLNGQDIVIFYEPDTLSPFPNRNGGGYRPVGSTGAFHRHLNGRTLTFTHQGSQTADLETGSRWSVLGRAVEGPLAGSQLTPILHGDHFWFAWSAFHPGALLYPPPP